ncbi:MAG: hypothetical protein HY303_08035 [Candidatus Wallbacteria bacterium]|nr:hypothetical protein [Candidatus Wallbacteria bacterium]
MTPRSALFGCLLALFAVTLAACGTTGPGLAPQQPERSGNTEETSFVQDDVLVSVRLSRTNAFQQTTLIWNGSLTNLGNTVKNARFEVLSTRGPQMRGALQTKIESTQKFGDLLPGQQQLIHVSFSFPSTHTLAVSARYAHD